MMSLEGGCSAVGVACSCALATSSPKNGNHRCHVAALSQSQRWEYSLQPNKASARMRWQEDDLSSRLLLKALPDATLGTDALQINILPMPKSTSLNGTSAGTCTKDADLDADMEGKSNDELKGEELSHSVSESSVSEQLQRVLDGEVPMATFVGAGSEGMFSGQGRRVVLSGSFNPLHHGHTALMDAAIKLVPEGVPCYEIAAVNADKGKVPLSELLQRVAQFTNNGLMVVVTGEPLFAAKASLMPGSTFVIGYDTAVRLINPKYYGGSESAMQEVLMGMADLGCDFLVAPRLVGTDFRTFNDLTVPQPLSGLFHGISGFRVDVSSTQIRQGIQTP